MKIKLVGKNLRDIRPLLATYGFVEDDDNFELIVAHGGDGTLLLSEHNDPGVPKLPLRDNGTAPVCAAHRHELQLEKIAAGKTKKSVLPKLEADLKGKRISGINDIFIHNAERVSALRYRVKIDGELYASEIVGDGVGLSTVHGSTAYYRSITHSVFRTGIGLAFSNSTEAVSHLVLKESSTVEIEIIRGPALVIADNSAEKELLAAGEKIKMHLGRLQAVIYGLEDFMCPQCRYLRHTEKYNSYQ